MKPLFVAIVVLGIIFLVMLCNSNKDGYVTPNEHNYVPKNLKYTSQRPRQPRVFMKQYMAGHEDAQDMMDQYEQLDDCYKCKVQWKIYDFLCDKHNKCDHKPKCDYSQYCQP